MGRRRGGQKYQRRKAQAIARIKAKLKQGLDEALRDLAQNSKTSEPKPDPSNSCAETVTDNSESSDSLATGGEPPMPSAEVNPETSMVVPHLMGVAPTNFSSNILINDKNEYVNDIKNEEYLDEALIGMNNDVEAQDFKAPECSKIINPVSLAHCSRKVRPTLKRRRNITELKDSKIIQRIKSRCEQDELLFEIKRNHIMNVAKMTESHLNAMHTLELRKVKAEAELAELHLQKQQLNL